jgi:HEAT repeat protein
MASKTDTATFAIAGILAVTAWLVAGVGADNDPPSTTVRTSGLEIEQPSVGATNRGSVLTSAGDRASDASDWFSGKALPAAPWARLSTSDRRQPRLEDRLTDPNPDIRIAAMLEASYSLPYEQAIVALQRMLLDEKDGTVHEEVMLTLMAIGGDIAVETVTTALDEPESDYRLMAVEQLAKLGDSAIHLLGQTLLADADPYLRVRAAELLAANGSPGAMAILTAVARDSDADLRAAAVEALSTVTAASRPYENPAPLALALNGHDGVLEYTLLDELLHGDSFARQEVITSLEGQAADQAVPVLRAVMKHDEDPAVRQHSLETLARIGGAEATEALSESLGDESPDIRTTALHMIWDTQPPRLIPLLGQIMHSEPDPAIRLEALRLLSQLREPAATSLIAVAEGDPDPEVRNLASRLKAF